MLIDDPVGATRSDAVQLPTALWIQADHAGHPRSGLIFRGHPQALKEFYLFLFAGTVGPEMIQIPAVHDHLLRGASRTSHDCKCNEDATCDF